MFSALAAVCTAYCAIEIVLITLHYIIVSVVLGTRCEQHAHSCYIVVPQLQESNLPAPLKPRP